MERESDADLQCVKEFGFVEIELYSGSEEVIVYMG
jgi:hypothetical protein